MTTILMVDDHELIRSGLAGAFQASGEFEVVGQAGSVAEALAAARQTHPDVVVTDVRLPDRPGRCPPPRPRASARWPYVAAATCPTARRRLGA